MFTEYFQQNTWTSKTDQVLTAFGARNSDASTYLTSFKSDFSYSQGSFNAKYDQKQDGLLGPFADCERLTLQPVDTEVVGYATTFESENSDLINSVQPIYYTNESIICNCLNENPTIKRDTKMLVSQTITDEDFIDKLQREGKLDEFVKGILSGFILLVALAILTAILCCIHNRKPEKKKINMYDVKTYITLEEKCNIKIDNLEKEKTKVKNEGYHPAPRKMKTKTGELFEIQEEPGNAVGEVDSLED